MAISGLQTRLQLWCLRGEKKGQEQKPLKGASFVSQHSSFTVFLPSFWRGGEKAEEVRVGKRLKTGYEKKAVPPALGGRSSRATAGSQRAAPCRLR